MADSFEVFVPRVIEEGEPTSNVEVPVVAEDTPVDSAEYTRWSLPEVTGIGSSSGSAQVGNASDNELLKQQAYDSAFQQGLADGQAKASQILADQTQQLQLLINSLKKAERSLSDAIEEEITALSIAIATQLLRHEIDSHTDTIASLVKQGVAALPALHSQIEVHLNPADSAALQGVFKELDEPMDSSWTLIEDESISRGGCRIVSDESLVDERLETRLERIVGHAFDETFTMGEALESESDGDDS